MLSTTILQSFRKQRDKGSVSPYFITFSFSYDDQKLSATVSLFLFISFTPLLAQAQNEKDFSINGLPTIYIDLKDPGGIITKEDKLLATMRIENAYGSNYDFKVIKQ